MPRTGRPKAELTLTDEERGQLVRWARRRKSSQALALRSRVVLGGLPEVWPASAGEASQRDPSSRAALIVALVAVWVVWIPVALFALDFTGGSGQLWGWLWVTLSLAPILLPTPLSTRRLRRGRGFLAVAGAGWSSLSSW